MILRTAIRSLLLFCLVTLTAAAPARAEDDTYTAEEISAKAKGFFGDTTEGLAKALEKVFADHGQPNAYITGEEVSGAIGVGLRYGNGTLNRKVGPSRKVYWQGPSIGWDIGGNASKVFTLIYRLKDTEDLFQRFPGVDGSFFLVAVSGVNSQQSGVSNLDPTHPRVGPPRGSQTVYL